MANLEHTDITGADAIHPIMYIASSDPGAVGPFKWWLDTTAGTTMESGGILKSRNAGDVGWDTRADIKTALDLKAALASPTCPTFTGVPAAPTAAANTNTTQIATTAYVQTELGAELVALPIVIGNGSDVITTGVKGYVEIPFAGTIVAARLLAFQSGSIVIDIWKDTYANLPPTVADTITASAKPTLSTAQKAEDTTLTGWTTSITAGDWLGFKVDSITTCTQVTLSLTIRRS
jgi:hypothetical protein